jgi:hypothetical protein
VRLRSGPFAASRGGQCIRADAEFPLGDILSTTLPRLLRVRITAELTATCSRNGLDRLARFQGRDRAGEGMMGGQDLGAGRRGRRLIKPHACVNHPCVRAFQVESSCYTVHWLLMPSVLLCVFNPRAGALNSS